MEKQTKTNEEMTMGEYLRAVLSRAIAPVTAICLAIGGLAYIVSRPAGCYSNQTPLDLTPEIRLESKPRVYFDAYGRGTTMNVEDKDRKRFIIFYDHGWNGTLDEVLITDGFGGTRQIFKKPEELEQWKDEWDKIIKEKSGEFEPIYEDKR